MADYIEREAVMQKFADHVRRSNNSDFAPAPTWNQAVQIVEDFPTADVRPVERGKWIDRDDKYYGWNMWACSACGEEFVLTEGTPDMNEYHFCPNCGADMREES